MNYYQRHIGDYARDTRHLSLLEHGVYAVLLDVYYTREVPFSDEADAIRQVAARSEAERAAVQQLLADFFVRSMDGWRHKRCDAEISKYREKACRSRENGRSGGRPPKEKPESPPPEGQKGPKENPDITQEKPSGLFLGYPEETGWKANQQPITINQEPRQQHNEPQEIKRPIQIAVLLRKNGADVLPASPIVQRWADDGVNDDTLLSALASAKDQRCRQGDPRPPNAGYIDAILLSQQRKANSPPRQAMNTMAVVEAWANASGGNHGRPGQEGIRSTDGRTVGTVSDPRQRIALDRLVGGDGGPDIAANPPRRRGIAS